MKQKLLSLVKFLATATLFAQMPCENGFAGDYPCDGYDLQSFIPLTN